MRLPRGVTHGALGVWRKEDTGCVPQCLATSLCSLKSFAQGTAARTGCPRRQKAKSKAKDGVPPQTPAEATEQKLEFPQKFLLAAT